MIMTTEISSVSIPVTYDKPGDALQQQTITFKIFQEDDWFKAIPLLSKEERLMTGLPDDLVFICINHVVVAANHMEEETLAVIKQIIMELEVQELL
jgi:hypothetical protein